MSVRRAAASGNEPALARTAAHWRRYRECRVGGGQSRLHTARVQRAKFRPVQIARYLGRVLPDAFEPGAGCGCRLLRERGDGLAWQAVDDSCHADVMARPRASSTLAASAEPRPEPARTTHPHTAAAPRAKSAAPPRRKPRAARRQSSTISQPCGLDGPPRVLLLVLVQIALERDRLAHGGPHGVLQVGRPGVEGGAVQENRPRDVEVVGERVEAVELVHPVGDGVGERVLLRVDLAGRDLGDRLGQVDAAAAPRPGARRCGPGSGSAAP